MGQYVINCERGGTDSKHYHFVFANGTRNYEVASAFANQVAMAMQHGEWSRVRVDFVRDNGKITTLLAYDSEGLTLENTKIRS